MPKIQKASVPIACAMRLNIWIFVCSILAGAMCVLTNERLLIKSGTLILDAEDMNGLLDSYSEDVNFLTTFQDNGPGNDGDLIHLARGDGDELLLRESVINEEPSTTARNLYWFGYFRVPLSHVRVLNFGKYAAVTKLIASINGMGRAEAVIELPANVSARIFVEVYGYPS